MLMQALAAQLPLTGVSWGLAAAGQFHRAGQPHQAEMLSAAAAGVQPAADAADNLQRFHHHRNACSAGSTNAGL